MIPVAASESLALTYTPVMRDTLFTIGYQGATVERLVETLAAADVSILIDTRETPMSRRPEFRRKALEASLLDAGIRYVSVPALGAPRRSGRRSATGTCSPMGTASG